MSLLRVPFEDVFADESGGNVKTPQSEYLPEGRFPVVDQGKSLIGGYVNDEARICGEGRAAIVFGDHTRCVKFIDKPFCMGADGVKVLRPKIDADLKYLYHYLRQLRLPDAGYDRHFKYLKRTEVVLLPLSEQRRIAAILDKADALRIKRLQAVAELDRLAQSLFVEMFGDPVANPKGWDVVKLGALGNLDRGISKHRPRNDPRLLGGRHPLIQTGDVANSGGYIREFQSTYSDLGLQQSKLWPRGTLCITIAANIAKTGILKFDACFPDSVVGFTSSDQSTVEYVRVWLSFLQKTLEDNAPESAQKNINLAILRDLDVPLPPAPMRERFTQSLRSANALSDKMREASQQLELAFFSLQHRAFRGEL